ncbi:MAG: RluA family pseudouridine synthase [Alicyclobacillus sp.]|nr:RluA family pseudouridine synthase [Alicyclobacillus sp.]
MVRHEVGEMEAGKKVHRVVRQLLPGIPLSGVYKMIRVGRVRLNGKRAKGDEVLQPGDVLELRMDEQDYAAVHKPERKFGGVPRELDVVYEDADLLIANKPAGLLVHGDKSEQRDTLTNRVLAYLYDQGSLDSAVFHPAPANRLDRNTSGLVVFGKTGEAARSLAAGFRNHTIRKWYVAIVRGRIAHAGEVRARLERDRNRNLTRVGEAGKEACTRYDPVASTGNTTVVRLELVSGRTHQIRAHMQHLGHPLIQDVKYGYVARRTGSEPRPVGGGPAANQLSTYWLHAGWLLLPDGRCFTGPLPSEFVAVLRSLGYTTADVERVGRFRPPQPDTPIR